MNIYVVLNTHSCWDNNGHTSSSWLTVLQNYSDMVFRNILQPPIFPFSRFSSFPPLLLCQLPPPSPYLFLLSLPRYYFLGVVTLFKGDLRTRFRGVGIDRYAVPTPHILVRSLLLGRYLF